MKWSLEKLINECSIIDIFLVESKMSILTFHLHINELLLKNMANVSLNHEVTVESIGLGFFVSHLKLKNSISEISKPSEKLMDFQCEFGAFYILPEEAGEPPEKIVKEFTNEVAAFALYTYAREYTQDTLRRAGLNPTPLPLIRNKEKLKENEKKSKSKKKK